MTAKKRSNLLREKFTSPDIIVASRQRNVQNHIRNDSTRAGNVIYLSDYVKRGGQRGRGLIKQHNVQFGHRR